MATYPNFAFAPPGVKAHVGAVGLQYGPTRIIESTRETCPDCGVGLSKYSPRTHKMTKRKQMQPEPCRVHVDFGIYEDTFEHKKQCDICMRVSTGQRSFRLQGRLVLDGSLRAESSVVGDEFLLTPQLKNTCAFSIKMMRSLYHIQMATGASFHDLTVYICELCAELRSDGGDLPFASVRKFIQRAVLTYSIFRCLPIASSKRLPWDFRCGHFDKFLMTHVLPATKHQFIQKWVIGHKCEAYNQGVYLVLDGNQKMYRIVCQREKGGALESESLELSMRTQCTEAPMVGELYCAAHVVPGDTVSRPTSRFRDASDLFWMPALSRCPVDKTKSSSPKRGKFRQRDKSAGVLVAASACGIFLDAAELRKSEMRPHVYFP